MLGEASGHKTQKVQRQAKLMFGARGDRRPFPLGGVQREQRERAQGAGVSPQLDSGGNTRACPCMEGPEVCPWDVWTWLLYLKTGVQETRSRGNNRAWTHPLGTYLGYLA